MFTVLSQEKKLLECREISVLPCVSPWEVGNAD